MCVDRNQEVWFVLVLRRHNLHPEQYLLYVYIPPFAPWALQNYLCNVRSWSSQREYVRRSNHLQINIWDPRLFGDLVFDEDEYPNVSRLVLEITLLPGDQIPPNVNLWPDYCVRYPAAMLAQNNFIPEPQPAMIPAAPGQVDGAAPPPPQHIPELTNNNILTLSNLSVPAQNPALAQAAHNPQAVRAALTYIDPLQVETRRSQRLATSEC
ncbi:hypothetical protein K457DRAFT_903643 [Linnemannia elongata AG-77]|uniref:Uncharacterized protein n=1 Tax=Linnemannia elongata AG-77 TaxID=1314771 RepID=A0A197JFL1_9FUNG|nr:hypothetical protein K457DRAFT_903643 [Linnemannia elongata AG-77]